METVKSAAHREIELKTKLPTVGASFQPTVNSTVLFYFRFRMCERLKLFQAVSVFCFSFI